MDDRSVHAQTIRNSVVVTGDGNHVIAHFGDTSATLPLWRRQVRPPDRRRSRPGDPPRELEVFAPDAEALTLVGRDAELTELRAWLDDPMDLSAHCLTGQAGSGKTRLALELCRAIDPPDNSGVWRAAFVSPSAIEPIVETLVTRRFLWDRQMLLVLDYAATAYRSLGRWLDALASETQTPKLRFLLLEREAPEGFGWWEELTRPSLHSEANRADLFLKPRPDRLPGLADAGERRALLQAAELAAHRLRAHAAPPPPVPPLGKEPAFDRALAEPRFGNPLNLVMAGVLASQMTPLGALGLRRLDAAVKLADRELARLERVAASATITQAVIHHMAAFNGLVGGLPMDGLSTLVARELTDWNTTADPRAIAGLLTREFPPQRGTTEAPRLATIQPDLIGEAVIVRAMESAGPLATEAIPTVRRAYALGQARAAEALVRVVQDFAYALEERGSSAADRTRGAAVLQWMTELAEQTTEITDLLPLVFALPADTLVLREAAARLTARLADILKPLVGATDDRDIVAISAQILNNLGIRLGALGRREDALQAAEEAVQLYRALAETRPDAFTPNLASSLNNFANRLSDLGRREDALQAAEEAVHLYRALAETRPGVFDVDLARSLWVVGDLRAEVGKQDAGLAALAEGVRRLTPVFAAFPAAVRGMMEGLRQSYVKLCEEVGREPDLDLLMPVVEVLHRLEGVGEG